MTTLTYGDLQLRLPTKGQVRAHMDKTPVLIAVIIGITVSFLGVLGVLAYLTATGRGTDAILVGLVGPVIVLLTRVYQRQTAQQKQLDRALTPPPSDPSTGG